MLRSIIPFDFTPSLLVLNKYLKEDPYPILSFLSLIGTSTGIAYLFPISSIELSPLITAVSILVGFSINSVILLISNIEKQGTLENFYQQSLSIFLHSIGVGFVVLILLSLATLTNAISFEFYFISIEYNEILMWFISYYVLILMICIKHITKIVYEITTLQK